MSQEKDILEGDQRPSFASYPYGRDQVAQAAKKCCISATQAAREHGVSTPTVYSWLSSTVEMPPNILQINKLRRENEELKRLLGQALLMQERSKKNQRRHG